MPLADYDTSVEKIAALKAAMIDPALVYLATSNFITDDNIYTISRRYSIGGFQAGQRHDNNLSIPSRIAIGTSLTDIYGLYYIKDSDITYSDPITTYQDRLAMIIESNIQIMDGFTSTNAGTYGSMILSVEDENSIKINDISINCYNRYSSIPFQIVVAAGSNFKSSGSEGIEYIDLPADW